MRVTLRCHRDGAEYYKPSTETSQMSVGQMDYSFKPEKLSKKAKILDGFQIPIKHERYA